MRKIFIISFLGIIVFSPGYGQDPASEFYYHKIFTETVDKYHLDLRVDSLPHYVLSNQNHKYLKNINLSLIQPETNSEFYVILDKNPTFRSEERRVGNEYS